MRKKDPNTYPPGLNRAKVKALIDFYDNQTDEQVAAEIEAAINDPGTVMVQVPRDVLPDVLKLIDNRKKTA